MRPLSDLPLDRKSFRKIWRDGVVGKPVGRGSALKVSCKAIGESSIGISTEQGYVIITNTGEIESFFKNGEPEYYHPWKLIKVMLDCGYAPKNYI